MSKPRKLGRSSPRNICDVRLKKKSLSTKRINFSIDTRPRQAIREQLSMPYHKPKLQWNSNGPVAISERGVMNLSRPGTTVSIPPNVSPLIVMIPELLKQPRIATDHHIFNDSNVP